MVAGAVGVAHQSRGSREWAEAAADRLDDARGRNRTQRVILVQQRCAGVGAGQAWMPMTAGEVGVPVHANCGQGRVKYGDMNARPGYVQ